MLESLAKWYNQAEPTRREIIVANLFLLLVLFVGTLGYVLIEDWTWFDGFYMTFITLTTIGFTEIGTLSQTGRIFTVGIAVFGIGTVAFIATRTAQLLISHHRLDERYRKRMIERLENHYILCGFGRIGRRIAADLVAAGQPFLVIDRNEETIDDLRKEQYRYVVGDAEDEETLIEAGLERAQGLILTLPEDSANVFVTLIGREVRPDIFILARTNDHKNERKLRHAGADKVVSPNEIGADRMAQVILRPHLDRFMEDIMRADHVNLGLEEVVIEKGALLDGSSLARSNFRKRFDAIVVAIMEARTQDMRFNPDPRAKLRSGDVLIVLGSREMVERLRAEGCQPGVVPRQLRGRL